MEGSGNEEERQQAGRNGGMRKKEGSPVQPRERELWER